MLEKGQGADILYSVFFTDFVLCYVRVSRCHSFSLRSSLANVLSLKSVGSYQMSPVYHGQIQA